MGDRPDLSITPGFSRLGTNVNGDTLTIESSFTTTYQLTSATSATASRRRGESRARADMVKVDLAVLIASGKKLAESFMIGTKLQENGKPVRLEVVNDTQPGDGPFPLLVFNHGSTGQGNDPALFTQTFSNPAFVEMFVKKGYMIAFPQRRGRVPGGGWQGFVLRLPGAGRGRAQGDVFTAPLGRPRRSLTQLDRRGGETVAVLFSWVQGLPRPQIDSPLPADTGQ